MMLLLIGLGCTRTDPSDEWTFSNSGSVNTPPLDETSAGGDDTGDTADSGGASGDTGDTGTGDTGDALVPPEDGTGYGVGDVAYNLQQTSQSGAPWALYDRLGSATVLLVGHMDLGNSMTGPMGFLADASGTAAAVALIGRNEASTAATTDDALRIAGKYGVPTVLIDGTYVEVNAWSDSSPPKAYVIDGEMVIRWVGVGGNVTASAISAAVDGL